MLQEGLPPRKGFDPLTTKPSLRGPLERAVFGVLLPRLSKGSPLTKEDKACAGDTRKGLPADGGASAPQMKDMLI